MVVFGVVKYNSSHRIRHASDYFRRTSKFTCSLDVSLSVRHDPWNFARLHNAVRLTPIMPRVFLLFCSFFRAKLSCKCRIWLCNLLRPNGPSCTFTSLLGNNTPVMRILWVGRLVLHASFLLWIHWLCHLFGRSRSFSFVAGGPLCLCNLLLPNQWCCLRFRLTTKQKCARCAYFVGWPARLVLHTSFLLWIRWLFHLLFCGLLFSSASACYSPLFPFLNK